MEIKSRILIRTGTTEEWNAATLPLKLGEPGYDTDNKVYKIGDGENLWPNLPAVGGNSVLSVNGHTGAVVITAEDLNLAEVATTGSYNSLTDKPNIPNVPAWALSENKPEYTWAEIQDKPAWIKDVAPEYTWTDIKDKPTWIEDQKPTYTKAEVGLGNVDNTRQYSESNPPPYPVTSVNGKTGDVTVDTSITASGSNGVTATIGGGGNNLIIAGVAADATNPGVMRIGKADECTTYSSDDNIAPTLAAVKKAIITDATQQNDIFNATTTHRGTMSKEDKAKLDSFPQKLGALAGKDSVIWSEVASKPDWIGATKPSYSWSEITGKPTWIGSSKPKYNYSEIEGDPPASKPRIFQTEIPSTDFSAEEGGTISSEEFYDPEGTYQVPKDVRAGDWIQTSDHGFLMIMGQGPDLYWNVKLFSFLGGKGGYDFVITTQAECDDWVSNHASESDYSVFFAGDFEIREDVNVGTGVLLTGRNSTLTFYGSLTGAGDTVLENLNFIFESMRPSGNISMMYRMANCHITVDFPGYSGIPVVSGCSLIVNCWLSPQNTDGNGGVYFRQCTYLTNCLITGTLTAGVIGFSSCSYLSNCEINALAGGSKAFSNCSYLSNCGVKGNNGGTIWDGTNLYRDDDSCLLR